MDRLHVDLLFGPGLSDVAGPTSTRSGSLTIVGVGIELGTQITLEARHAIEKAEVVLYLVTDLLSAEWIRELNPSSESLEHFYEEGKARSVTYSQMVDRIVELVREGKNVCVAAYGHPGVFAQPAHESMRRAREEGFAARMLPGVSAEDCFFADLGVDPGKLGCQSYEATRFLVSRPMFDPRVPLLLWQVSVIGHLDHREKPDYEKGLAILTEVLREHYPGDHEVVVYEAAQLPVYPPTVERMALSSLPDARLPGLATLYVPPAGRPVLDGNTARRLGMPVEKPGQA